MSTTKSETQIRNETRARLKNASDFATYAIAHLKAGQEALGWHAEAHGRQEALASFKRAVKSAANAAEQIEAILS